MEKETLGWIVVCSICLLFVFGGMWGCPKWNVYNRTLKGQAALKQAEWDRQITVAEALAEKEAADLRRQTDVIRAKGTAEANKIIDSTLTMQYITWKWVEGLHDGSSEVIYIPTEANLPILEATRIQK
ncbi:MAG: hypothetical protein KAS32_27625 [Candidatus Peribacteraceae bacterium]|nr:hypothetical protein [Candidatus Peribacteraceae bacterium]